MATASELARLRRMIDEPDNTNGWTDEKLEEVFAETANANGSLNFRAAAKDVWEGKAGSLAALTDVTESSSSRRNSQYFDHALKMAASYSDDASQDPTVVAAQTRPRSTKMTRATRG